MTARPSRRSRKARTLPLAVGWYVSRWCGEFPVFAAILLVLLLIVGGVVGGDYGLVNLFWHQDRLVQLAAGASVAALGLLLGTLSFVRAAIDLPRAARPFRPGALARPHRRRRDRRPAVAAHRLTIHLAALLVPLGMILLVWSAIGNTATATTWPLPLGYFATLGAALLLLRPYVRRRRALRPRLWHGVAAFLALVGPFVALDRLGHRAQQAVTAAMTVCLLLATAGLVSFLTYRLRLGKLAIAAGLLVIIALTNGQQPYKLSYPGLEVYGSGSGSNRPRLVRLAPQPRPSERPDPVVLPARGLLPIEPRNALDRAIRDLDEAIRRDPGDAIARVRRARARQFRAEGGRGSRDRDLRAALEDLNEALALRPDLVEALWLRADLRQELGDLSGTWDDLKSLIRIDPGGRSDWLARGLVIRRGEDRRPAKSLESDLSLETANSIIAILDELDVPGVEARRAQLARIREQLARWRTISEVVDYASVSGRLDDGKTLDRMGRRLGERGGTKPRVVVVATSGGGIAAAYWTMLCLTELERRSPDFPYHVRIVTGASGGMVGAATWVAGLPPPETPRNADDPGTLRRMMAQDFLTPVVRRMVLRDLPSILCPADQRDDRGQVLERVWNEKTGGLLGQDFHALMDGESRGWRPSLIITPMVLEQGRPLVISNLDLEYLSRGLELAKIFPAATKFRLSTALRMNAAFPYVTPAAVLPTDPPQRVVDAGYLDNYGVGVAAAWLDKNRDWLRENTSGVALVQIRAYASGRGGTPGADESPLRRWLGRVRSGLEPFTTPLEGYAGAKAQFLEDTNQSLINLLSLRFAEQKDGGRPDFFRSFSLACPEEAQVPLSWDLSARDRRRLDDGLRMSGIVDQIREAAQWLTQPNAPSPAGTPAHAEAPPPPPVGPVGANPAGEPSP